jgi:hypothetical protein
VYCIVVLWSVSSRFVNTASSGQAKSAFLHNRHCCYLLLFVAWCLISKDGSSSACGVPAFGPVWAGPGLWPGYVRLGGHRVQYHRLWF